MIIGRRHGRQKFVRVNTSRGYILISRDLLPSSTEEISRIYPDKESELGCVPQAIGSSPRAVTLSTSPEITACSAPIGSFCQQSASRQSLVISGYSVFPNGYESVGSRPLPEPCNRDEILRVLSQRRRSLSVSQFSDNDIRSFRRISASGSADEQGWDATFAKISGQLDSLDSRHRMESARRGNSVTFDRANGGQLNRDIAEVATGFRASSAQNIPLPPNFILQTNEQGASCAAATQEANYGGALGAKNIHNLQSCGKSEAPYDNNAYAITSVYHGEQLEMYTSHPVPPVLSTGQPGIAMTQLGAWNLIGDVEEFRMGAAAYRNARDWAHGQFNHATYQANIGGFRHAFIGSSQIDDSHLDFAGEAVSNGITIVGLKPPIGPVEESN